MAYDMNAAYKPPGRAYGGYQQPQRTPVQDDYPYGGQEQYGYEQRPQYADQGYGGHAGYEQDARYNHGGHYDTSYDQSYGGPAQRQPNGHGQRPVPEERQYGPRYRQRAPGGREQNGYEQPPSRPHAGYEQPQHPPRHDMRHANGHRPPQQVPQYDPRYQRQPGSGTQANAYSQPRRSEDRQYDPRSQQNAQARQNASPGQLPRQPAGRPEQSPPPVQGLDLQSKPNPANIRQYNIDQQKAEQQKQAAYKQRSQGMPPQPQPRPQNQQPQGFAQPTQQSPPASSSHPSKMSMEEWKTQAKAKMHADAARPEVLAQDNAFPTFPTYEHKAKESISNAAEHRAAEELVRPSTSNGVTRPHASRDSSGNGKAHGSSEHHSVPRPSLDHKPFSFDAIQNPSTAQSQPQQPLEPQHQASASTHTSPVQERHPQNWPTQAQQSMPPQNQYDHRQSPHRAPAVQQIDVRQAQEHTPTLAYMDHQPLSPASIPQRPSTAQGGQPLRHPQAVAGPNAPLQDQQYNGMAGQPPRSIGQSQARQRETLADIYDDYHSRKMPPPQVAPDRSREEEIEASMPDFDSAAPGGTSLLHKRSQKFDQPTQETAPAMPQVPPSQHPDYGNAPKQGGGITHGFAFGIPGEQLPPQQPYERPYQEHSYPPQPQPGPPVQAPYMNEHVPRRSMDDARQMPYRQAPPQKQRPPRNGPPPNGYPPRGPMPPHLRPEMERGYTNTTTRSDPGPVQHRGGSAPPMQPGVRGPPPGAGPNGPPVPQQRPPPGQPHPQQRYSNPDSLPRHPIPVRPGLMEGGPAQPAKPPPVRNYNRTSPPQQPQHPRQPSIDITSRPVTHAELDQLRAQVSANPNNLKASLALAKRLVEASNVLASENGRLDQRSTAKNRERYIDDAHKIVKRLVGQNYPDAQFYLADCYGSGQLGLEPDPREAFNLYQAAAKGGHGEAAFRTAMCCELGAEEGGGTRRDYAKALQWYRRAATLGDPNGAFKLGVILLKGLLGQPKNVGEAVTWLKRAAERATQDNPQSLYEMAQLYESANNNPEVRNKVVADDKYALELFDQAAKWGHKGAQFRLGQAYEYGALALPIDNRASITWYTKAAAQGEHNAELALSGWYLTGADNILEQSDTEAYLWARKAASSEPPLAKAMFAMGYFTETGIGCPASIDEAKRWYGRAGSYKFPKAQERLEELRRTGGKGAKPAPVNGKLARKDQKRDEAECVVM